jgi:hypothetical protein
MNGCSKTIDIVNNYRSLFYDDNAKKKIPEIILNGS